MRPLRLAVLVTLCAALFACSRPDPQASSLAPSSGAASPAQPRSAPGQSSAPSRGTLALGEPIAMPLVSLTEIAKSPARYANQTVATSGKVTAVCQEMGCWMELRDETGQAHVRMHGHSFFVPKTASGHFARVQARVLPGSTEECAESPPPGGPLAKVQLDATGVELD